MKLSKTQKYFLFGVPVAVGLYLIVRQIMGKKTYNDAANNGNTDGGDGDGDVPTMEVKLYKVTTLLTNLNVREQPSTSSRIVDSLAKGTIIRARPSNTSGWFEAFPSDSSISNQRLGYVSADYITFVSTL